MQKLKFLAPALPLTVICVVIALLLSVVNAVTADRIAENAVREKDEAISTIFPNSEFKSVESDAYSETVSDVGIVYSNDEVVGYYAESAPVGFKGTISLIVGCDAEGRVIKVTCTASSETPAVGTRATEESYLSSYKSKKADEIGKVDTITGATISSKAVRLGIENAVKAIMIIIEEGE